MKVSFAALAMAVVAAGPVLGSPAPNPNEVFVAPGALDHLLAKRIDWSVGSSTISWAKLTALP
jgi:hypothetical protein